MSHVFVSYARKDSETVDHIVARLNRDGFEVWLDREDIEGGDLWHVKIVEAIDNAYACVLMLSPASMASDNVRKEVDVAEGANKDLLPVLLASVELPLPAKLRYQLAGIQWIEYYRDPEAKYAELAKVLHARKPKQIASETQMMREVEIVIKGLNLSKFGPEEQEKLLRFAAEITNTPRADINLSRLTAGSIHAFVNMPVIAAYQMKTAALNRDLRLINFGIHALRLTGDRKYVLLKTGQIAPIKPRKSGCRNWLIGSFTLIVALLISSITIYAAKVPNPVPVILTAISTHLPMSLHTSTLTDTSTPTSLYTLTPTNTVTPTPSNTPTSTKIPSPTPTVISTMTATPTLTRTSTPTPTKTSTPRPSRTSTYTPTPPDTTPPVISSISVSDVKVNYPYPCGLSTTLTVWADIYDPSGIRTVTLIYLYNDTDKLSLSMNPIRGGPYQATINVGSEADKYLLGLDGKISITIEATDGAGNTVSKDYSDVIYVYYCAG